MTDAETTLPPVRRRTPWVRRFLLLVIPAAVVGGSIWIYLHAGRYVETDNAYVKSHKASISAEVPARIVEVLVEDNQPVSTGTRLVRLERQPFEIALQRADAALAKVAQDLAALGMAYAQAQESIRLKESNHQFALRAHQRVQGLVARKLASVSSLDDAEHAVDTARREVDLAHREAARILVDLGGQADVDIEHHPRYLEAKAERDRTALDLAHTDIQAPFNGIVSHKPQVGDYVNPGKPLMSLVADSGMWVEANFKETDLTHIEVGQPVDVTIDAYPGEHWAGRVHSISEATGAEFALLPPQNASGNWVKVVQRIPVRIELPNNDSGPDLRAGMSVTAVVDTGHKRTFADLMPGTRG